MYLLVTINNDTSYISDFLVSDNLEYCRKYRKDVYGNLDFSELINLDYYRKEFPNIYYFDGEFTVDKNDLSFISYFDFITNIVDGIYLQYHHYIDKYHIVVYENGKCLRNEFIKEFNK